MELSAIRSVARRLVPNAARVWRARIGRWRRARHNRRRDLETVFTEIYERAGWGAGDDGYCSGAGSRDTELIEAYCGFVRRFMKERGVTSVLDLGCGDFFVGSRLSMPGVRYTGVDIVAGLVERNRRLYGNENVGFEQLDITRDELPDADLCLVRQVLQHLSNDEVARVLPKLRKYRYVLITEHYPAAAAFRRYNRDKVHGGDTRVFSGSGVYLDRPPFDLEVEEVLCLEPSVCLVRPGETIRTFLHRG